MLATVIGHVLLWRTTFGFRLRMLGASSTAAAYAGVSFAGCAFAVMALAGAFAGIAGGIEVVGVHYRLIEGFFARLWFQCRRRSRCWPRSTR